MSCSASHVTQTPHRPDEVLGLLSPREREVFYLIAAGLDNREIARSLYISDKTVKNYATGIRRKLGLANRTQVALYAVQCGLVPLESLKLGQKTLSD